MMFQQRIPYTECLEGIIAHGLTLQEIKPQSLRQVSVLIAAHGNSLRALVMQFEHLTPEEILRLISNWHLCAYTLTRIGTLQTLTILVIQLSS